METPKITAKKKTAPRSKAAATSKTGNSTARKMDNSEFHKFFVDELKDIYWAEKLLSKSLPKLKKAATSTELSAAFEKHTEETLMHISTLEEVFDLLGEARRGKKCEAMEGLVAEAQGVIEETEDGSMLRDAGLILAAQKVEHYEIATYGTLVVFAQHMGHHKVANLLQNTLDNEKETDVALTRIAMNAINEQAAAE